ncbi:MAG: nucleotidyltransferase domain-containing protein [Paludibacteraceae bacterium]|nr:nucleotidyltransferase domain-containing protein [Paludibacteraceae bacterium]
MASKDVIYEITALGKSIIPKGGHLWLFGSRARGDNRKDSDWDLLILMDKQNQEWSDFDNYAYPFTELGNNIGVSINPLLYTKNEWEQRSFTPFYHNVQSEKLELL